MSENALAVAPTSFELPRKLGRRVLLKLVARGGMGDVYLAATTGLEGAERASVVKTIRRDHIHDGSFLARFLDEARVQSQLNHPGVAQVLEAGSDEQGEPFTVVEYVEGRSLSEVTKRATQLGVRIGWAEACAIAIEMGQALSHVHERSGADGTPLGIVHRDLSPQNVMLGYAGEVKLIDFGTARGQNRKCHTVAGVVFAKPGYVAPEIARHEVGDGRIDVYAMGVILWELCKNQRMLAGDAQKHMEDVARARFTASACAAAIGAPAELDDVLRKLLANNPDERYLSAATAASDLAKLLGKAPVAKTGERSVRARVASLMLQLFPAEPSKSRAEFAKLVRDAKDYLEEAQTPPVSSVMEAGERLLAIDPNIVPGTPYRLMRKIGEGASGTVWEAEHTELGRKVALKILEQVHSSAIDSIDRFRREARAVANLSHPNVAFLHDFGKSLDGRVYLAMELLEGETLAERIARTEAGEVPMGWKEAVEFAIEAARALEAVHGAGLVHRDLKPENLYVTREGVLKLLDFGVALAKSDTGADEKRQKGFAVFGTPEYMAPEQVSGEVVDGRCDLYALGCVLYELLAGKRAFEGDSAVVVMGKHLREKPEALRSRVPERGIPRELDAVVLRALAKAPEHRFDSAVSMREALEAIAVMPMRKRGQRRRQMAAAAAVALAAVCGVGIAYRTHLAKWAMHFAPPAVGEAAVVALREPASVNLPPQLAAVAPPAFVRAVDVPTANDPRVLAAARADARAEAAAQAVAAAPPVASSVTAPVASAPPAQHVHVARVQSAHASHSNPKPVPTSPEAAPEAAEGPGLAPPAPVLATLPGLPRTDAEGESEVHALPAAVAARGGVVLAQAHTAPAAERPALSDLRADARAAIRAHDWKQAASLAADWLNREGSVEAAVGLAHALEALGHRDEARNVMIACCKRHPDSEAAARGARHFGIEPSAPQAPRRTGSHARP